MKAKLGSVATPLNPEEAVSQQQANKPSLSQQLLSKPSTMLGMTKDALHSAPSSRLTGNSSHNLTGYQRHC